jgi:hypothetical protein
MTRVALLATLAGCVHLSASEINTAPRAMTPRGAGEIDVFSSGPPTRPHIDVAILSGRNASVDELRAYAANRGCDGLVYGGAYGNTIWGTCIVYSDSPNASSIPDLSPGPTNR